MENNEKRKKESSLILRKAKFQAIFKFVLSSASGGAGGGKYNRISAFVSMPVLLIRSSLEFFRIMRKNRDDRLYFGFAKVLALALIFTLITTAESRANDEIPTSGTCNSAGTCLWNLSSDGTMTISAATGAKDVRMDNYYCQLDYCRGGGGNRPWENYLQDIKNVVVGDNITYIGNDAFQSAHNLETVTGMKDVKTIGSNGVFAYTGLTSITIPEGVTSIGNSDFYRASSLTSITIPDSVTSIGWGAFAYTGLTSITIPEGVTYIGNNAFDHAQSLTSITIPDNIDTKNWSADVFKYLPKGTNIVCQGDLNTCYEKLAKYFTSETCPQNLKDVCNCSASYCISPSRVIEATDPLQCTGNYGWSGAGCSRKNDDGSVPCVSGFVEWDKQCWSEYPFAKKRWTPAEANEWLHDGNDNFVVITFKK